MSVEKRHERLDAACIRKLGERGGGDGVVFDGIDRVRLHQRHVLERRRMDDDVGFVLDEHSLDAIGIRDIAQRLDQLAARAGHFAGQLAVNRAQRRLGALDKDELLRIKPEHVTAYFPADGPPGPRDEHRRSLEHRTHVRIVAAQVCARAGEQVSQFDAPQAESPLDSLAAGGGRRGTALRLGHADTHAFRRAHIAQGTQTGAEQGSFEDHDVGDAQPLCTGGGHRDRSEHAGPSHADSIVIRIVVEQARDERIARLTELDREPPACIRCIDHEHAALIAHRRGGHQLLVDAARQGLHAADADQRERPVEQEHRPRNRHPSRQE